MMLLLAIFAAMALMVAWLLILPIITSTELLRRDKQKTLFFILLATVIFPLSAYYFLTF